MVDRFFFPEGATPRHGAVELDEAERDHALRSRRLRAGDPVELLDGAGTIGRGTLTLVSQRRCVVEVDALERAARVGREVHLALSVPRGPRMDGLVDQAAQLGVASIRPVALARSVAAREDASPARLERWRRILREAAKQSGEPFVPELGEVTTLEALLAEPFAGARRMLHLSEDAAPLAETLPAEGEAVRILVGPEGGFTAEEVARCVAAGERVARLGRARLRIETAALAALVLARLAR